MDIETKSSSKSKILSRLARKLSMKQLQLFRKILNKHQLSEKEICEKYGEDRLEDLTGSDALDVITGILLAEQKHESQHKFNNNH